MRDYIKQPGNEVQRMEDESKAANQGSIEDMIADVQRRTNIYSENTIQQKSIEEEPLQPKAENKTGLPDHLKTGVENLSGYSMDDVRVHYNSDKPAQLNALAYAQGTDIHVAPGQEEHLPHEAWHVVQQKQGRVQPTMQMQGVSVNDNEGLEREADVMGNRAIKFNSNKTTQRKNMNTSSVVQLEKMSITITDNVNTVEGVSGRETSTKAKLRQWPTIYKKFEELGQVDIMGPSGPYKRNAFMCAEPNAFANLLDSYSQKESHPISKGYFSTVNFPQKAKNIETNTLKAPCTMCSKWVTDIPPLKIKDTVKPEDLIKNRLQETTDKQESLEQYKFESTLGYFMDEDYKGDIIFDDSRSIKVGIESIYIFFNSALPNRHNDLWNSIIHKNNSNAFVSTANNILENMQPNKTNYEDNQNGMKKETKNLIKQKVELEMKKYSDLCSRTETIDLIIQLVKNLNSTDISGDINNINRHVALLNVPELEEGESFNQIEIENDGNIWLFTDTNKAWRSTKEKGIYTLVENL